ncbi:MAG: methionyl-tRNA formyltransferase [Cyclobacteriaceae bacterium]
MGTPEFAVASLQRLVEEKMNIVAVITAPDKPKGRGKQLGTSPVKDYAVSQNIPLLQPTNLKDPEFIEELKSYEADLQIVVAFRMLPEVVWNMPPHGSFNLHGSLLPDYRGAAPINWAIINGEKETGVTTFKLQHEIDTGNILFQEKEPIRPDDNIGTVYERLMQRGSNLIVKSVKAIQEGNYKLQPQILKGDTKHAPKIFREDCKIDWNQSSEKIRNFIRGLSPYPAAWTTLDGLTFKIYQTNLSTESYSESPGTFKSDGKKYLDIVTVDGALRLENVQLQGKKRMNTEDFLRGYQLK